MPKIDEPVFQNPVARQELPFESHTEKKNKVLTQKGQQSRVKDALEKNANGAERGTLENLRLSRPGGPPPGKSSLVKSLSEKYMRQDHTAEAAYKRGLPLIYRTDDKLHGGIVVVLHGANNKNASIIDARSLDADDSSALAADILVDLDGPQQSKDFWNTKRIIVAAMFHAGFLVNKDGGMARYMASKMSEREKSIGLNGALQYCVGQNLELTRVLLDMGAKPNEVSYDDGTLPLETAISFDSESSVRLLLEKGAKLDINISSSGTTPRSFALLRGSKEINSLIANWAENGNK